MRFRQFTDLAVLDTVEVLGRAERLGRLGHCNFLDFQFCYLPSFSFIREQGCFLSLDA
jgi:hypothetical protein